MYYDPQFYETRALGYAARLFRTPVHANVRLVDPRADLSREVEIDGLIDIKGQETALEVKSYPLDENALTGIVAKYRGLNFHHLKVIAPSFERASTPTTDVVVETVPFVPDLSELLTYYAKPEDEMPAWFRNELETGWHHVRYKLAKRGRSSNTRFLNQIDKRIRSFHDFRREVVDRIGHQNPPIKVYWSPKRWLSPKDLYFRNRPNVDLGGPLVFDIDGIRIHEHHVSCLITGPDALCEYCFRFAKQHAQRLVTLLREHGFSKIEVLFSGRQGFHIYVLDEPVTLGQRSQVLRAIKQRKIKIDTQVTLNGRGILGMPMSVHGYTMMPVMPVPDLGALTWASLRGDQR